MSSQRPHYIIDGYNLLHAVPSLKNMLTRDAVGAREQLVALIARQTIKRKFRCTVVFDGTPQSGAPPPAQHSPVHVVHSGGASADSYIRNMIEKSKQRAGLVVVSSDHEILNHARACSCTTYTSKFFSLWLFENEDAGEEKEQASLSKNEVEAWLKIFGGKDKDR
jgi:predicted RNA-binding protein with PIN domain